ncbi:asparagine synthetase B family protein [Vacuolonema iberomarrocanum]|uniref:asparagine synthetase B family protein n=1 Tax=Vacuolonema iberomarrocanum TaxID=3454632 RepID=UPI001A0450C5|nr:asparagine synthase [filamentous cyanobacterium LEGE 07170]
MEQRSAAHLVNDAPVAEAGWGVGVGRESLLGQWGWHCQLADSQLAPIIAATQPPTWDAAQQIGIWGDGWLSNAASLRQRLAVAGVQVADNSHLHLIAALWQRWGCECLPWLEGMFALVIWERSPGRVWLVRDRSGTQTLYYLEAGGTLRIARRLRDLAPWHSHELDAIALRDYLCCAFVPGERTLWKDVRELRPATALCWSVDVSTGLAEKTSHFYSPLRERIVGEEQPLEWHGRRLRSLLDQVVQEYLPAGEPVGVYLSGGLDSSSITALAAKWHDRPVHTYSIHFGADCPNELEFSEQVARHCQTAHHVLEIPPDLLWSRLQETLACLDDPIGDPLTVPNLLLGYLARETASVILNGEGGDPCFGGPKNQPMLLNQLYRGQDAAAENADSLAVYLASFHKCAIDLPRLLKPAVWEQVKEAPSVFTADLQSDMAYLNRLMALNIKFKGADHILTKVNNLTRAAGVEGRSPLFDQRVVEMSMEIPPVHKLSGAVEKAVLKQAVADLLPAAIINRPKSGMMVPVHRWFRQSWQRRAKQILLRRNAAIAPYLNQSLLRDWLNYRGDIWGRYGVKLWLVLSLELWLQANRK